MNTTYQRRMAADILKCGANRVWIHPNHIEDVAEAVTREDVKALINTRVIQKKQKKGISRARAKHIAAQKAKGKRKGHGSRKGAKKARTPKKKRWMSTIRPIRRKLKELRADGTITPTSYRRLYMLAKGGTFKSKAHLEHHMKAQELLEG